MDEANFNRAGPVLRGLRLKRGMSQAVFAEQLGISQALVSKLERGERDLSLATARRIAELYGVDVAQIFSSAVESSVVRALHDAWWAYDQACRSYEWLSRLTLEMSKRLEAYQRAINEFDQQTATGLPERLDFHHDARLFDPVIRKSITESAPPTKEARPEYEAFPVHLHEDPERVRSIRIMLNSCSGVSTEQLQAISQICQGLARADRPMVGLNGQSAPLDNRDKSETVRTGDGDP